MDEVRAALKGNFRLAKGVIEFSRLDLAIPGADLALSGNYTFDKEAIDFRGKLRLQAKMSQTMSGWKRWALKPADPFFAKDGAGDATKGADRRYARAAPLRTGPGEIAPASAAPNPVGIELATGLPG